VSYLHVDLNVFILATCIAALLQSVGVHKAHIIGTSMGGFIAQEFALNFPSMVSSLVLISTSAGESKTVHAKPFYRNLISQYQPGDNPVQTSKRFFSLICAPGFMETQAELLNAIETITNYKPQSPESYSRQVISILKHNTSSKLKQIHQKTLVIHGKMDELIPVQNGEFLAENIEGSKLIIYDNIGHCPAFECPERLHADILTFLHS